MKMKLIMDSKYLILVFVLLACSFKQKEKPIDPELLPGAYCHSHDKRDSIFVYPDKTYKHTYHRSDGTVMSQTNTWYYKSDINDIFFESFLFYNDGENVETEDYRGSWPAKPFVGEKGEIKLRYSESVYYVKVQEK